MLWEIVTFILSLIDNRSKMAFFRKCAELVTENGVINKQKIFDLCVSIVRKLPIPKTYYQKKTGTYFPIRRTEKEKAVYRLFALGMCYAYIAQAKNYIQYMCRYIAFKAMTAEKLNDKGAFGDVVETVCHLLVNRKEWRVKIKNLHVSSFMKTDLQINGHKTEVAHNGKTWLESTRENPMNGKFSSVIYGVFSETDKKNIYKYIEQGNLKKGIAYIANRLYFFENKNDFYTFMTENVGKSKMLLWKESAGKYQTVYNPGKHTDFKVAIEKASFPTIREYLGETDFYD